MQLYPSEQLLLLAAAFLGGVFLGALSFAGKAVFMLLGVSTPPPYMKALYEKPLPLLSRAPVFQKRRGVGRRVLLWCGDFFFCIFAFLLTVYILYRYHNGAFRLSVPLLVLLGFFLWRRAFLGVYRRLVAYLAYGLAVCALYLRALCLLPLRLAYKALRALSTPVFHLFWRVRGRYQRAVSQSLCRRQLARSEQGRLRK